MPLSRVIGFDICFMDEEGLEWEVIDSWYEIETVMEQIEAMDRGYC